MKRKPVLRISTKLLAPFILLFALYVQFHGDFGPGGGFQAGVIFASAFILYGLVFGLETAQKVLPATARRVLLGSGVLIYAGTGIADIFLGGNFLNYSVFSDNPLHGQHIGINLVEFGVGTTVFAAMVTVFFTFAGQESRGGVDGN